MPVQKCLTYMKTKKTKKNKKIITLLLFFFTTMSLYSQGRAVPLKEIEDLYKKRAYSFVLEKGLGLLNAGESRMSATDAAFLYYYVGMAYKKNDNKQMAADYLKKIGQKAPTSEYLKQAYLELAEIYKDDYLQKEMYLDKVFQNYPRTPEAANAGLILGRDYLQLKNYKKALPVLETLVNLWKNSDENPELYMLLAIAYAGVDDYIEALVYVRLAEKIILSSIQSNPQYLFIVGKVCYNNLNFDSAIKYLETLLNVFPEYKDNPEAAVMLANAYEKTNQLFLSTVFLIKALEKKPSPKVLYTLYLNLGRVLGNLEEKDFKAIKQNYPLYADSKKMLTLVLRNSPEPEERKMAAILLSGELKKSDNLDKAIENIYDFLKSKRDPVVERMFKSDLDVYLDRLDKQKEVEQLFLSWVRMKQRKSFLSGENLIHFGEILYKMKMVVNAEEVYVHLLKYKMFSDFWGVSYQQLARIYFQLGRYNKCLDNISRLNLDSEPERSEFNYYKALCYERLKMTERLQELLDTVEIGTIYTIFQYKMVGLKAAQLEKEKKYNEALVLYQGMMQFAEAPKADQGQLLATIADLYFNVGDMESSLNYYRLAEQTGTNLEWVLYRTVTILRTLGKKTEARTVQEKLKNVKPGSFWLQQLEKYGK